MYSIRERVRYSETDSGRHLPITGIVNYFQDCSAFQSEDIGVGLDFLKSHKRGWVLSSWQIIVERYRSLEKKSKSAHGRPDLKGCMEQGIL